MLTVTAINLVRADMASEQLDIFSSSDDSSREKRKKREETVDKIRQKFGRASIIAGSVVDSDLGINDRNEDD